MAENIKVLCDREDLVNVADAVRAKTNTSAEMTLNEMATKIGTITGGGGTDTSDATATAEEIFAGETAYTAEGKVTGTFTIDNELTEQNDLISQISTLVAQKANPSGGTDTSDATATAGDMLSGKTAYVKGEKITGTIASKTSSDLITSGATVTVPAGHYVSQATKSVATGSAKTPATTVTKNPTISVSTSGKITASVSGTQSVTPTVTAGYVSSGTAGTITVSGSATKQLTTKSATTYTPSTSNQTIASGTYLTGVQTIKGDTNLVAGNIKSGVSIFGVAGTYTGSGDNSNDLTIVQGTFTPTHKDLKTYPITITGLPFSPKAVVVHYNVNSISTTNTGASVVSAFMGNAYSHVVHIPSSGSIGSGTQYQIVATDDGFTLKVADNRARGSIDTRAYCYWAIG